MPAVTPGRELVSGQGQSWRTACEQGCNQGQCRTADADEHDGAEQIAATRVRNQRQQARTDELATKEAGGPKAHAPAAITEIQGAQGPTHEYGYNQPIAELGDDCER